MAALSAGELRQLARIRNPRRRHQFACSRWLLRVHLAHRLDRPANKLVFRQDADAPPSLVDADIHLSLSHSGGLCVCVSSLPALVGCDVEHIRPRPRINEIASYFFHPSEAAALAQDDAQSDFYRLWTLKEATHKARGRGIGAGLRQPAFALRPTLRCFLAPDAAGWRFAAATLQSCGQRYALALATPDRLAPDEPRTCSYGMEAGHVQHKEVRLIWQYASADSVTAG